MKPNEIKQIENLYHKYGKKEFVIQLKMLHIIGQCEFKSNEKKQHKKKNKP